jgi:predicted MPP superfamily phosphohydrolase
MLRADIRELARRVTELKPDLVAVTGDHVMPFSEQEHGFLVEELAAMGLPTVACLGNHDLPVAARLVDEFRAAGMRILVDESTVVEVAGRRLEVVGVTFHWRQARDKFLSVLDALPPPPSDARLLLAHDPRLFAWLPAGRFHLVLSGHTHGGQVGTDMFGVPWSVLRPLGLYDQGRFDRDGTALWVHRGNWHTGLPPRMGIAGEIVVHEVYA